MPREGFGLAEVRGVAMADWLGSYVRRDQSASLADFARAIASRLNAEVPISHRRRVPSGFHIAGFGTDRRLEFWFVRNITDAFQATGAYEAREDFQGRDAPNLQPGHAQIYRNGDILAHVLLWAALDEAITPYSIALISDLSETCLTMLRGFVSSLR